MFLFIFKRKESYENRKYSDSEEMFQNILLVEPENKNAKEYLRLSKEKKLAMLKNTKTVFVKQIRNVTCCGKNNKLKLFDTTKKRFIA